MSSFEIRFTYLTSTWAVALLFLCAWLIAAAVYLKCFRRGLLWPSLLLSTLRFFAIAVALVLLLRPLVRYEVLERREERLVVLIDTSSSMKTRDSVGGESRLRSALSAVDSETLSRLAGLFRPELYVFSAPGSLTRLRFEDAVAASRRTVGGAEIRADGYLTDIASALGALHLEDGPIAAIVLFSDGRDHGDLGAQSSAASTSAVDLPAAPVYAVGLGSGELESADMAWGRISHERRVLRGSRVEVRGSVVSRGLPSSATDLVVRLGEEEIERHRIVVQPGVGEVKFELVPRRPGRLIYELALEARAHETVLENNHTYLVLEVTDKPLQVLFFDGRARWQYKFVRRALAGDSNINVTGLVTLSADRLLQQGRSPVSLESGLPVTAEGWKAFDVLVLGNVRGDQLPERLQRLLLSWVAKRGGGLIVTGGAASHGQLGSMPLGGILPFDPGRGRKLEGPLAVAAELAGLEHPVTRGLLRFLLRSEGRVLGEAFDSGELLPGAELLLSAILPSEDTRGDPDEETVRARAPGGPRHPLLATRQYGEGRVVAWFTESDWRWLMNEPGGDGERLFTLLWRRMVRWAARRDEGFATGEGLELSAGEVRIGEKVTVTVAAGASETTVLATDPRGEKSTVFGSHDGDRWTGRFTPRRAGVHLLELPPRESSSSGSEAVLIVHPDTREVEETRPDWKLLRTLAEQTGGEFLTLAECGRLTEKIVDDSPGMVTEVELGTDRSWGLYLTLVILLTVEWVLRRKIFAI